VLELARFRLDGGGTVTVEVGDPPRLAPAGRPPPIVREATATFERALADVRDAAGAALGQFQDMVHRPDSVEISFGIRLDAQAGALIAKTGAQGHFEVKLTWQPEPAADPGASPPRS
jgi:uncharacterized protein YfiM (DUF2279 family)